MVARIRDETSRRYCRHEIGQTWSLLPRRFGCVSDHFAEYPSRFFEAAHTQGKCSCTLLLGKICSADFRGGSVTAQPAAYNGGIRYDVPKAVIETITDKTQTPHIRMKHILPAFIFPCSLLLAPQNFGSSYDLFVNNVMFWQLPPVGTPYTCAPSAPAAPPVT